MYIHIGKDVVLNESDIIGIFNLQSIENTKEYKNINDDITNKNNVIDISDDCKKTYVMYMKNKEIKAYISNISSTTIEKRNNLLG